MSLELLKSLYVEQFRSDFPFEGDIKYTATSPLPTEDVHSIYKFRYDNHMTTLLKDPDYELILDELKKFQGPKVIIHLLDTSTGMHLCFTDEAISVIVGVLVSPRARVNSSVSQTQKIIKDLKAYQVTEKLSPNPITGYTGLNDSNARVKINQLINSNVVPLIIFLIKNDRLTDEEVLIALEKFFQYLHYSKIAERLDTEDKEELLSVIMNMLRIIEKGYLPISFV